jgi:hypothetical protein
LGREEARPVFCPFCGAPQRRPVPSKAVQVECQYCGRLILIPPAIGGATYRCANHPESIAVGKCNDCGENFCEDCLSIYPLRTDGEEATLYLCSSCRGERYAKKADAAIYSGAFFLLLGLFSALVLLPVGTATALIGLALLAYGLWKRRELPEGMTLRELRKEKRREDKFSQNDTNVEELYGKLLTYYVSKWGAVTGTEFLENEIGAYVGHGASFEDAVRKVYERNRKKSRKI